MPARSPDFNQNGKILLHNSNQQQICHLPDPKSDDWHRASGRCCGGYIWCATHKTLLKPYSYNHRTTHGELITLDEEQRLHIDAVNTVWSHANKDNTRSFTEEEIKELENSRHEQS
ncbi:hypothetical protein FOB22_003881 [Saccharomyces cerevisiae]|nr:hypothetical protein FOB22_003881 [Saccharomyces cerevisiae]